MVAEVVGALAVGKLVALTAAYLAHMVAAAFADAVMEVVVAAAAVEVGGNIGAAGLVVARDGAQPAYHEPHGGCISGGWAYMHNR